MLKSWWHRDPFSFLPGNGYWSTAGLWATAGDWGSTKKRGKDCSTTRQPRHEAALGQVNTQLHRPGVGHCTDKGAGQRSDTRRRNNWDRETEILSRKIISWSWAQAAWTHSVWCKRRKSKFIYLYCISILIGTTCILLALPGHLRKTRSPR